MKDLQEKYARVLLESCLKIDKNQPLFISYNVEREDFVRIIIKEALNLGVTDIYLDGSDPYIKHNLLQKLDIEELKPYWNREIWNTYAKKNAAFLMLASETPGLMKDIDKNKISELTKYSYETRKEFDLLRDQSKLAWTIAAVPTATWAKTLYNKDNSEDLLWNEIFDICGINKDNPVTFWNEKIKKLDNRAKKLNNYQFKTLHYEDGKTDFSIDLPKNHLWASGKTTLENKKEVLVNFPTEEVFTSPDCFSATGIVYSSKPLSYQDIIINNFWIRFEKGKVIDFHAEEGEETLKKMISICENSNYLGEVALVANDSPISNRNKIFLETLYDENASCHIALGDSFSECIKDGTKMDKDTLLKVYHLNKCDSHVDFMIGTKNMNITGITQDNREIPIFINGNFTKEFK